MSTRTYANSHFSIFRVYLRTTTCKYCIFIKNLRLLTHKKLKHMVLVLTLLVKYFLIHLLIFTPTCKIFVTMSRVLVLTPALKSALLLVLTPTCKSGLNMELIRLLTQKKSRVFYKYLRIF